ncbi:MAG: hypothetical protein N3B17_09290 [Chlorobi bacterium]|nr:hypothetical protein [Chlorobiota bacterium]
MNDDVTHQRKSSDGSAVIRKLTKAVAVLDEWSEAVGLPFRLADIGRGAAAIGRLARSGPWAATALVLIVVALAGFGVAVVGDTATRAALIGSDAAILFIAVAAAFVFASLGNAIALLHPGARLVLAAYMVWYFLLGPVLVLPRWIALVPVWTLYAIELSRRPPWYWVIGWSLLLGRLSWNVLHPLAANLAVWTAFYTALGLAVIRWLPAWRVPTRALLFGSMLGTFAGAYIQESRTVASAVQMGMNAVGDFLGMFWLWLAVDFAEDVWRAARRTIQRMRRWIVRFSRWIVAVVVGCSVAVVGLASVDRSLLSWHAGAALCGLIASATTIGWLTSQQRSALSLLRVVAGTVVLAVLYWIGAGLFAAADDPVPVSSGWQLLLATAPLFAEQIKHSTFGASQHRQWEIPLAFGLLGIVSTAVQLVTEDTASKLADITAQAPAVGLVLVALPYAAARMLGWWDSRSSVAVLFALGYLAAYPAVLVGPQLQSGSVAVAVLVWAVAHSRGWVTLPTSSNPRLATLAVIAGGTLAFYHYPLVVPIPFLPQASIVLERLADASVPPLFGPAHSVCWASLLAAAAVIARLPDRRWTWAIAACVAGAGCWLASYLG